MSFSPLATQPHSSAAARGVAVVLSFLTAVTATFIFAALVVAPAASAAPDRPQIGTIGTDGTPGTSFVTPQALAFDQGNDRLYALDQGNFGAGDGAVHGFDVTTPGTYTPLGGTFPFPVTASQGFSDDLAVDSASHNLFFSSEGDSFSGPPLHSYDASGSLRAGFPVGSSGDICGSTVAPDGNVWISDFNTSSVIELTPAGAPTGATIGTAAQGGPCHIAFNAAGDLYFGLFGGAAWRLTAASGYTSATQIDSGSTNALTVDRSTGNLYVAHGSQISVWDSSGTHLYDFGAGVAGANYNGVAIDQATDQVYASDSGNLKLHVFGPVEIPATATTNAASSVNHTHATLHGHLDTDGGPPVTDCLFEYGPDTSYGSTIACAEGDDFGAPADVSAELTGLSPGDTRHFRLKITTAVGDFTGADQVFTTPPIPLDHPFISAFGPDGTSGSSFQELDGLAFDQSGHLLFALDRSTGIWGFDASASPSYPPLPNFAPLPVPGGGNAPQVGVDSSNQPSAGNVYFATGATAGGELLGFDATGVPLGGNFPIDPTTNPGGPNGTSDYVCGVAVDSAGNVWVSSAYNQRILKYNAAGVFQSAVDTTAEDFSACNLAFDSDDDLYATGGNGPANQPTFKYTASSGYTAATLIDSNGGRGTAVNLADDHLFLVHEDSFSEYSASGSLLGTFATDVAGANYHGVTIDAGTGYLYLSDRGNNQIRAYGPTVVLPDADTGSPSAITNTSATVSGTVGSNGVALTDCRFEYVTDAAFEGTGFANLASGGSVPCDPDAATIPNDLENHPVTADITGLNAGTTYHYRVVAENAQATKHGEAASFDTTASPAVETTGSPIRTTTTARLDGRVNPNGAPASYHFEYGDQGPCDANPCTATPSHPAGSGTTLELVSQQITGLSANTAYHYRVVADNGNPAGAGAGEDMVLTTRASDAPLSHGDFPGPPGSDRAWEQVNTPDTGGSPVNYGVSFSDDGDRAVYTVAGGTPDSPVGSVLNQFLTERTADGWHLSSSYPTRDQLVGGAYFVPAANSDLSSLLVANFDNASDAVRYLGVAPGQPAAELATPPASSGQLFFDHADHSDRMIAQLRGSAYDPSHPAAGAADNLYDLSSGSPELVSLLPGNVLAPCGTGGDDNTYGLAAGVAGNSLGNVNWITPDGSKVIFPSQGAAVSASGCFPSTGKFQLYARDVQAGDTTLISGPTVSGPACSAALLQSNDDEAFFYTQSRLGPEDRAPAACSDAGAPPDGDVYRYTFESGQLNCVTCVVPGLDADVYLPQSINQGGGPSSIGVAEDGSRVYFSSPRRLVPGAAAAPGADDNAYRVDVATGEVRWLGSGVKVGDYPSIGTALSTDGSVLVFRSASPRLDAIGGQQNGGEAQYYRYDDRDRSLVCLSCPQDGSTPRAGVELPILTNSGGQGNGQNFSPVDADGDVFFAAPTRLISTDQNTAAGDQNPRAGTDIYEWRDGRLLLVTDGLSDWSAAPPPEVQGVSETGDDVFFLAAALFTPDAIEALPRLYTAHVGGGFKFPAPATPCPLGACQADPSPPPNDPTPGSSGFSGSGNQSKARAPVTSAKKCKKGSKKCKKVTTKCKKGTKKCKKVTTKCKTSTKKCQQAKKSQKKKDPQCRKADKCNRTVTTTRGGSR